MTSLDLRSLEMKLPLQDLPGLDQLVDGIKAYPGLLHLLLIVTEALKILIIIAVIIHAALASSWEEVWVIVCTIFLCC